MSGAASRPTRAQGEQGVVGGAEALPFAVLVFVIGTLLVANAWAVVDAKLSLSTAAREAARAYVEAPDEATAGAAAEAAAHRALAAAGRDPSRTTLLVSGDGFGRCLRVVIEASTEVPSIALPAIGGFGDPIAVVARHSELVDPYRDGLEGPGC